MIKSYEEEKRKVLDHQTKMSDTMKNMFDNFENKFNSIIQQQHRASKKTVRQKRRGRTKVDDLPHRPSDRGNSDTEDDVTRIEDVARPRFVLKIIFWKNFNLVPYIFRRVQTKFVVYEIFF